jgi:hypothetical protein
LGEYRFPETAWFRILGLQTLVCFWTVVQPRDSVNSARRYRVGGPSAGPVSNSPDSKLHGNDDPAARSDTLVSDK